MGVVETTSVPKSPGQVLQASSELLAPWCLLGCVTRFQTQRYMDSSLRQLPLIDQRQKHLNHRVTGCGLVAITHGHC